MAVRGSFRKLQALILVALVMAFAPVLAKPPSIAERYSEAYIRKNIVVGKTTISEVEQRFGKAHQISNYSTDSNEDERIYWDYSRDKEKTLRGLVSKATSKILNAGYLIGGMANDAAQSAVQAENQVSQKVGVANELFGTNDSSGSIHSIKIVFENGVVTQRSWH